VDEHILRVNCQPSDPYTWDMTTVVTFEVLTLTDEARNCRARCPQRRGAFGDARALREVTGTRGAGYAYDLYFSDRADAPEGAAIGSDGGVKIVVPLKSVERLRGRPPGGSPTKAAGDWSS